MKDMFRSLIGVIIGATIFGVFAIAIQAQTQGDITGLVTDSSGAVIPGANVTVTNKATAAVRKAVTNSEGLYAFPSLPPGVYILRVEQDGFKISQIDNIKLEVQQAARLDVTLEVGQVGETVTIDSIPALLNSENATLGTVVENRIVADLPLNGRQYLNLVALSPNANVLAPFAGQAGNRQGGERAMQSISAGGQRIFFNYYTLDGVNNMDVNFNTYVALPSIDAIQEFKIQVGVYPAEFGHQSTQVNVLTKSGGNTYHGSLFEFHRNDRFDAKQYQFTSLKPKKNPFKWNDYGFEVDGPVRIPFLFNGKDKLFFMTNYEALRRRQNVQIPYSVATEKMFRGDFSEQLIPGNPATYIYDPNTGQPFPGNIIPTNRLDPISLKFLKYYNTPNVPGTNSFEQTSSQPFDRYGFVLRFDFVESTKSQWMGRYNWGDETTSTQALNAAGSKILTNYKQWAVSNTRTLSSNLVNEARFGYTSFFNSLGTLSAGNNDVVAEIGIPNQKSGDPITWGIPNVVFQGRGLTAIGDANDGPFAIDNSYMQFFEKLSWVHGKHTFSFGGEFSRQNFNQVGNQFSRGVFVFQANETRNPTPDPVTGMRTGGDAFAEFLLGRMFTSTTAAAVANAKFKRNVFHAFIDDTWKVTPKLTLSLGLRYELTPPFTNTLGDYFTVKIPKIQFIANAPQADWPFFVRQEKGCTDPYEGLNIRWTSTNAVCGGGLNNNLRKTQYLNFAPRIGIAYSFNDKTVIRGGFGVFYMQDIANAEYFDMARNIAARVDLQTTTANPVTWGNAIPGGTSAVVGVGPPFAWAVAYDHRTPRTYQYMLNIQRQLGANWSVELGYLGSQSRHLYGFQNVNQALPGPVNSINSRRPYPNFGVLSFVNDVFKGSYNAGSVKLTRRFSEGISVTTNYTWAKSIDNASGTRTQGLDTLFPQDSSCLECERGLSSFDVRHRWVLGAVYDLPLGKGRWLNIDNAVVDAFVGGWQLSTNSTIQSGVPQTLNIGFNNAGTNNPLPDRPSYSGVGNGYLSTPTPTPAGLRWYDPASFIVAPEGQFGNVGRNTMITPMFRSIDAALGKRFTFAERHTIQLRLEAFNVFNIPSWGAPNGNIRAGDPFLGAPANAARQNFGLINTTSIPMRQIQLGIKYLF
jgi:hypothetical protein